MFLGSSVMNELAHQFAVARDKAHAPLPASTVGSLVFVAGALLLVAIILWIAGGHHAGFAALNSLTPLLPEGFWSFLTSLGDSAVALALFLPLSRGNWHLCRVVLISAILGLLWTHGFKNLMPLDRPAGVLEPNAFHAIGDLSTSGAFPSGHAQTAMMLATIAALCARDAVWRWVALVVGVAAALSRVFVGMHWPIDALAGAAGGVLTTLIALAIAKRLGRVSRWPIILLLSICVVAAVLVATGHPADHPAAQPWLSLVGIAALVSFAWPFARAALSPKG